MQNEIGLYKRAEARHKRELGSIKLAAEIATRNSGGGSSMSSGFAGFSNPPSILNAPRPPETSAATPQPALIPNQIAGAPLPPMSCPQSSTPLRSCDDVVRSTAAVQAATIAAGGSIMTTSISSFGHLPATCTVSSQRYNMGLMNPPRVVSYETITPQNHIHHAQYGAFASGRFGGEYQQHIAPASRPLAMAPFAMGAHAAQAIDQWPVNHAAIGHNPAVVAEPSRATLAAQHPGIPTSVRESSAAAASAVHASVYGGSGQLGGQPPMMSGPYNPPVSSPHRVLYPPDTYPASASAHHYARYARYAPNDAHHFQHHPINPLMPPAVAPQPQPYAQFAPMGVGDHFNGWNRRTHDLPSFSGRADEWRTFICAFQETTRLFGYSDMENMLRLQKCLAGEAKKRVASILLRPEHVGRAIDALTKAYGRPETLLESQFIMVRNLPRVEADNPQQMIDFSIAVDGLLSFLEAEETQHQLFNTHLLNELEEKLPMSDRKCWARVARSLPYPSIRDFAIWLDDAAGVMSSIRSFSAKPESTVRSRQSGANASKARSERFVLLNVASEKPKRGFSPCAFCAEAHDIWRCDAFRRLTVHGRLQAIKKNPICYGCLQKGHMLPACPDRKPCGVSGCVKWHDPLLHPEATPEVSPELGQSSSSAQQRNHRGSQRRTSRSDASAGESSGGQAVPFQASGMPNAASTGASSAPAINGTSNERSTVLSCRTGQPDRLLLFRVVPVVLYGPQHAVRTFALLDEGSSLSLIDDSLARELGLDGVEADLDLQFANAQGSIQASRKVAFDICGVQPDAQRFEMTGVYSTSSLALPTQSVSRSSIVDHNDHLADVPFAEYVAARPRLLIGLDHHHLGIPLQIRTSALANGIVAAMTKLGWVLFGSDGQATLPGAIVLHVRHHEADANDEAERWAQMNELVRLHFTTEDFGVKAPKAVIESDAVKRARQILATTTKRVGGRFETGLLWARDEIDLPDSRDMALQRLRGVEARMRRDAEYARQYREQIKAYCEKGYARRATTEEAAQRGGRSWFLPHFAVQSISKPGKFRLVFDAAARASGVSLNSELLAGPDVNVPLTRLLFRFRLGTVGVCGDVREMYHQVLIRPEDQVAQRFLWRDGNTDAAPETFIMNVMTFGSSCSPASAQFVKNANASAFESEHPEAASAIRDNHYVDDYVASFTSSGDALRITTEVVDIQRRGGFELRGIVSNCVEVQRRFGVADTTVDLEPEGVVQRILGMTWETSDDVFRFQTRFGRVRPGVMDGTKRPTKRDVLSVTMSIFDPFGLLADFLLASKVVLQELWRANVGWDEPIGDSANTRWQEWRKLVERTRLVRIPRCYSPSILSAPGLQLHVFADASEEAFAAVAYWRIRGDGGVQLSFVAGKVRCAPLKMLSIPRMELQAAMLAARLAVEIRDSHVELTIEQTILWSDSETVLKWLRCDQRRYKVFVAVRVAEIVEHTPAALWRWVPSALNPADDATRVKTPLTFNPDSRWLHGPKWLVDEETSWPQKVIEDEAVGAGEEEVRSRFVGAVAQRGAVEFARFADFFTLARTIAWVKRFAANARERREQRIFSELSAAEVRRGTETACLLAQQEAFGEEISILRSGRQLTASSSIFTIKPYLDERGLLRVHGRTDAANESFLPSGAKRPILLPRTHRVTILMVRHQHEQLAHQFVDATIAAVRAKYWVPQLRRLVKQVQADCPTCRLRRATPIPPSQGQLPRDRLDAYARPFTNTGLDFFGPVAVTVGRRREKRWVALFTCLTVRAVHLEIAADLTTDACLLCIRNLCNLRGVPSLIRCDNGTNFVGARNEMDREPAFFDADAIQRELSRKGVEWRLNCPANPEAGGAWERLVQCVKRVLRVTLKEEAPRTETLRSLLIEAANIVNARPLTHLQVTPDDPEPLTPNHFLLGGPNVATVPNPEDVEPRVTRKQWQICRGLSRRFWRQFVRDYLPELTRRSRHYPEQTPLQVGDLVIVCDEQQPRSRWSRGRVVGADAAPDGVVRTASVQTASGTCRRPVSKLARLDVGASDGGDGRGAECRQFGGE